VERGRGCPASGGSAEGREGEQGEQENPLAVLGGSEEEGVHGSVRVFSCPRGVVASRYHHHAPGSPEGEPPRPGSAVSRRTGRATGMIGPSITLSDAVLAP